MTDQKKGFMKYRRKQPDTFEAIKFTGDNLSELVSFLEGTGCSVIADYRYRTAFPTLIFRTPSRDWLLSQGDWLVHNLDTGKVEKYSRERFDKEYEMEAK